MFSYLRRRCYYQRNSKDFAMRDYDRGLITLDEKQTGKPVLEMGMLGLTRRGLKPSLRFD